MEPSSTNKGFIQSQPVLKNPFYDDVSLKRVIKLTLPPRLVEDITPELAELGEQVLSQQIFDWVTDAERNLPYLKGSGRDAFGKPKSELVVTEGWRKLQEFGFKKGFVAFNYDTDLGEHTRLVQFTRCHLWEASCANTLCPAAMQDGAARLLQRHLTNNNLAPTERLVFQNAFDHLTSRDPATAWTSGQWMTERTGGSDVSQTETIATHSPFPSSSPTPFSSPSESIPMGPWSISGFKWFSSATDSNCTILLAKTHPSKPVSAFFAPMRIPSPSPSSPSATILNGITISRLKSKFGTQSLPTAELELSGLRAWLIGSEGAGIREISTILTLTRVHTTVSSVGYVGRGLAIARSFALVRPAGLGRGARIPLSSHPLHMRTLSDLTASYHALNLLVFYTIAILGVSEHPPSSNPQASPLSPLLPPPHLISPLLRVLSSLHKSYVCEAIVPLLYTCMSSLGGVGYLLNSESEQINVSRIFRDACVGAIWEGTTDVLAGDTIRALKHREMGRECVEAVEWVVTKGLGVTMEGDRWGFVKEGIRKEWEGVKRKVEGREQGVLLPEARKVVFKIAEVLMGVLYLVDVASDPGREVEVMALRWMGKVGFVGDEVLEGVRQDVELDQAIVYGVGGVEGRESKL